MPAPDAAPEQPTPEDAPGRAPADTGDPSPPDVRPLIGRDEPLRVLARAVEATTRGVPGFVEILGEPGIGKTRLLGELETSARARGLAVLSGRAAEFQHEVPLAVVVDALDDHLRTHATRLRGKLPGPVLDRLAAIFPALEATARAVPGVDPVAADRYRGFSAVRDLLDVLAAPSGLLVVLDDVHWADEASVELVDHLLRHPPCGRVLIAMAYRTAQVPPRLAAALQHAGTSRTSGPGTGRGPVRLHRIAVRPFDAREVEEFLTVLAPGVSGDRTATAEAGVVGVFGGGDVQGPLPCPARSRRLHAASRGNPFYLEALVRGGPGTGGSDPDPDPDPDSDPDPEHSGPPAVPSPVRMALAAELDALPADALLVARAAAVVGDDFDPGQVAVAARISRVRTLDALDELAARDVVRAAAGTGRFGFRHPLVRHVAYSCAPAAGGSRPTPRPRHTSPAWAPRRPPAPTTSPGRRPSATGQPRRCSPRPPAASPTGRRRPPRTGSGRPCGCCPRTSRRRSGCSPTWPARRA
ncbi:ATP-binding protein [Kitasatospora arboriphila]